MKKVLSLILALVLTAGTLLGAMPAASAATVIAKVSATGLAETKVTSTTQLRTLLDTYGADGKAVVTLVQNLNVSDGTFADSFPFTLNLGGKTVSTTATTGTASYGLHVSSAAGGTGASNTMKIVGPGTVSGYQRGVVLDAPVNLEIENATVTASLYSGISLFSTVVGTAAAHLTAEITGSAVTGVEGGIIAEGKYVDLTLKDSSVSSTESDASTRPALWLQTGSDMTALAQNCTFSDDRGNTIIANTKNLSLTFEGCTLICKTATAIIANSAADTVSVTLKGYSTGGTVQPCRVLSAMAATTFYVSSSRTTFCKNVTYSVADTVMFCNYDTNPLTQQTMPKTADGVKDYDTPNWKITVGDNVHAITKRDVVAAQGMCYKDLVNNNVVDASSKDVSALGSITLNNTAYYCYSTAGSAATLVPDTGVESAALQANFLSLSGAWEKLPANAAGKYLLFAGQTYQVAAEAKDGFYITSDPTFTAQKGQETVFVSTDTPAVTVTADGKTLHCPDAASIRSVLENNPGATLTLLKDLTADEDSFLADGQNFTLDLNGKTLTAAVLDGSNCSIEDSRQSGLLKIPSDKALFSPSNTALPLWDEAAGGFRMAEINVTALDPAWEADSIVYTFRFDFAKKAWESLFTASAANECGLKLLWNGTESRAFKMTRTQVAQVMNNPSGGFRVTVTGTAGLTDPALQLWFSAEGATVAADTQRQFHYTVEHLLPVQNVADTTENRQKAVIETGLAYYRKGTAVQYDITHLCGVGGRYYGDRTAARDNSGPEMSGPQRTTFSHCQFFVYCSMYHSFGHEVTGAWETFTNTPITNNTAAVAPYRIFRYDPTGDETVDLPKMQEMFDLLQPGDVVAYTRYSTTTPHNIIWAGDLTGDGVDDIIHSGGTSYDQSTMTEVREENGTVWINTPRWDCEGGEDFFSRSDQYDYFPKLKTVTVLRYTDEKHAATDPLTEQAKSRILYPGLDICYEVEGGLYASVVNGGELTYTLTLNNTSLQDYEGLKVNLPVPRNAKVVKVDGAAAENAIVSRSYDIPAGESKTLTVTVKATGKAGSIVNSGTGYVHAIPLPVFTTGITSAEISADAASAAITAAGTKTGMDFANAYLEAAGLDLTLPALSDLQSALFDDVTLSNTALMQPKAFVATKDAALGTMQIPYFFGGRYVATECESLRVKELRNKDLEAGDILIWQETADGPCCTAVHNGETLVTVKDGVQTSMTQTDLDRFIMYRFFIALRPTQRA